MKAQVQPFIVGSGSEENIPLQRFLPPLQNGMVKNWLERNIEPGAWVIDPFGASPLLPFEAAQAGYRVMVVCNNPILQFLIEVLASAPQKNDFLAALADLAKEKRETERLETHLQSLYTTECPICRQPIPITAYIWKKDEPYPVAKVIKCKSCKSEGEYPVSESDLKRLASIGNDALHRARALQRVNLNQETLIGAQEAIQSYLTRPLYFIFTLINRIERLQTSQRNLQLLTALILNILDEGNTLWPWPPGRNRPKQISTPTHFRENNLWDAIENGIDKWCHLTQKIPLVVWPDRLENQSGICLFRGRIGNFSSEMAKQNIRFQAAVTVLPRPNQSFWTYSALWSGWLWGRNAVYPLKGALERRRFDWFWYSVALHQNLTRLREVLEQDLLFWGIIPEAEFGFLTGTLFAAESAGFNLFNFAARMDDEFVQCTWKIDPARDISHPVQYDECQKAIRLLLENKNEPLQKSELFAMCLVDLAKRKRIPFITGGLPYYSIKDLQQKIPSLLDDETKYQKFNIHSTPNDKELWWQSDIPFSPKKTYSDKVEQAVQNEVLQYKTISLDALDQHLCELFPDILTPSRTFIEFCLDSYAEQDHEVTGLWHLKTQDYKEKRDEDLAAINDCLRNIGHKLGYLITEDQCVNWVNPTSRQIIHRFFVIATAMISEIIFQNYKEQIPNRHVILPGSRSKLLIYKLQLDPRLENLASDWSFIKYRSVFSICQKPELTPASWEELVHRDPPRFDESFQISIF